MAQFDSVDSVADAIYNHIDWTGTDFEEIYRLAESIWNSALESKVPPTLTSDDLDFVRQGKIQAIKKLRQISDLGLKDAKDLAEAVQEACNKSPGATGEIDRRISNLEWDVQCSKVIIKDKEEVITRQGMTISQLRSLVHSLVDKI